MKRKVINQLVDWKNSNTRKPLLITGVRQCGKTYIMKAFGEKEFKDVAYFNFEKEATIGAIFEGDLNIDRIIENLGLIRGKPILPGHTLLIFDEIQSCSKAITSLKYFCEEKNKLHIMCAGSLLGVAVKRENLSFPVGKIDRITMGPMTFSEFLMAYNENFYSLINNIAEKCTKLPEEYLSILEESLKLYYIIGGMPEAVFTWIETHDINKVEKVQNTILQDYQADFAKHAPKSDIPKLSWIWDSVPNQLAKDNHKFIFSQVKEGKRAKELEDALEWLVDAGLIYKVFLTENIGIPLSNFANIKNFKVYMADVGLLRNKAGLSAATIMNAGNGYNSFKGALAENFILTELVATGKKPYYWRSGNSAEVDFVIEHNSDIVPIEVKADINTKAKSFGVFCKKYNPKTGFKFSMKNIGDNITDGTIIYSLPLSLAWKADEYLDEEASYDFSKLDDRMVKVLNNTYSKG